MCVCVCVCVKGGERGLGAISQLFSCKNFGHFSVTFSCKALTTLQFFPSEFGDVHVTLMHFSLTSVREPSHCFS